MEQYDLGKVFKLVAALALLVFGVILLPSLFENVGAGEITVIQAPFSGKLNVYTTPGVKWQGFGTVTTYKKRDQFWFSEKEDQGKKTDDAVKLRFNDGGHASLSGSIAWEMPSDIEHIRALHSKYGSQVAIEQQLVRTVVERSMFATGPLMSSAESYAERRNDLISFIDDQIQNGVFKTYTEEVKEPDPITGEQKTVQHVRLVKSNDGQYARQEQSALNEFGIRTFNLSINNVTYDDTVERQIQQQQQAKMQVQTSIANAKKAEQDAITAQKNGEAEAAKAKWEQEVIKAKQVTEAESQLAVAKLHNDAAEQEKQALMKKGEGEGAYKRAVMQADGALDKKLAAYVEVQKAYAQALGEGHVQIVPTIQSGGGATNGLNFIDLLGMKAARDLAVDVTASGASNTKK